MSTNTAPLSSPIRPWLTIVGIGEDGRAGLSPAALSALEAAEIVFGGARHLALAGPLIGQATAWPSPFSQAYPLVLSKRGQRVCVLASGDPFHYGIGAELARLVPSDEMICFPQASAFSLAAARLGWSLPDCDCLSLHGRSLERIVPHLQPGARILALSWDETTPRKVADFLKARDFPNSDLIVFEAMGGPRERMLHTRAGDYDLPALDPLNVVALKVVAERDAEIVPLATGLDDRFFESDGQLTKAEIRSMTLSALAPRTGELLWDVGAGAGSISIEWMLRHPRNKAIAIETQPERAERILRNAASLGTPDLEIVIGQAPNALKELPSPDAIFIGGGASDDGVFEACWSVLKPGGRLVVNAVTLETEQVLAALYAQHGGTMRRIAISRLEPVGTMHGWRAAMPVTQWVVVKP